MKKKISLKKSDTSQKNSANESIFKKIFRNAALVVFGIVGTLFVFVKGMLGGFDKKK